MAEDFNVFISWSGEPSRRVAQELREWLPRVLQSAKPFMSDTDIAKGAIGFSEIGRALDGIRHGIICLTPGNLNKPWVMFEAGAIAKKVADRQRLCPYLVGGLESAHLKPPLSNYQYTVCTKDDTLKMLLSLNEVLGAEPVPREHLQDAFDAFWPRLDKVLRELPKETEDLPQKRNQQEMMEELLDLVRGLSRVPSPPLLSSGAAYLGIPEETYRGYLPPAGLSEYIYGPKVDFEPARPTGPPGPTGPSPLPPISRK